jgi:hypothetical protein
MAENTPSTDASPILLRSDRILVEIARPGTVYTGTRFDWTGFITQVTLDREHTFCVPESLQPGQGTGGIGLCNEFGIERPIGYDDAQPGEAFPKLGIGLLTRPDEGQYNFFRTHEIAQPFPIDVQVVPDAATFVVAPLECRGYAARLTKAVSVEGSALTIAYQLENVGSRRLSTHEYCHNFCGIDGHPLGPEYRLRIPYEIAFEDVSAQMVGRLPRWMRLLPRPLQIGLVRRLLNRMGSILATEGGELWCRSTPERQFYRRLVGFAKSESVQWELVHTPSGLGMREYDDFAPSRVALWGASHVISAEVFVDIELPPGETMAWTRRYEFFD